MTNHTLTLPQTQEPNQVDLTIKQTITFNLHIYKPLLLRSSPSQNNTRGHTLIQLLFRLSTRRRVNKIE